MDQSHGYEDVSRAWIAQRGSPGNRADAIGLEEVRAWARTLPSGSSIMDVGCGPGLPLTAMLVEEGLQVFGVDASPSFVAAFRQNLPGVPVACASVEQFDFFERKFDAVLAVGLVFLFTPEEQAALLRRLADLLHPAGRLLFTAPAQACTWKDVMTGAASTSVGTEVYQEHLERAGLQLDTTFHDSGGNHYFSAHKAMR